MRQRNLVIGLLILLAFVFSSFTYAYWSTVELSETVASNTVNIGEGKQQIVTASLNAAGTGTLVPSGEVGNSISTAPTASIVFTFDVDWNDNTVTSGATGSLAIVVGNISNATAATYLVFTITGGTPQNITEGAAAMTITITVTLTAPANETDYLAIINAAVTFDVTFTVTP